MKLKHLAFDRHIGFLSPPYALISSCTSKKLYHSRLCAQDDENLIGYTSVGLGWPNSAAQFLSMNLEIYYSALHLIRKLALVSLHFCSLITFVCF